MDSKHSRRGLISPALLLVGLTATGAFALGQRASQKAQDPAPPNPAAQRIEMIQSLRSLEASFAKMEANMELQTKSLQQLERINGALLRLVHQQVTPVDTSHGHNTPIGVPSPPHGGEINGPR